MELLGYRRADGRIGIRNHVLVMSTVLCVGPIPSRVASQVKGVVPLIHPWCNITEETVPVLVGLGSHPNVAGVIVVGLECEDMNHEHLAQQIAQSGKPCEALSVRKSGGTLRTIEQAAKLARAMVSSASKTSKEPFDVSELILGIKCGGSDSSSGLAANPSVGVAVDKLVDCGATVIFSEPLEAVGGEAFLVRRASDDKVASAIVELIDRSLELSDGRLGFKVKPLRGRLISQGNMKGGLTTLEEKSLGAIAKTGSAPIQGVLKYATPPPGRGLYLMDNVGTLAGDVATLVGFIAAGAQLLVFTTGRGSVVGTPVAPVIKVCGNPVTYQAMQDSMDVNAGVIIEGKGTIQQIGRAVFDEILDVAAGKLTAAEILGHYEFEYMRRYWVGHEGKPSCC